jgi:hypothetical protein
MKKIKKYIFIWFSIFLFSVFYFSYSENINNELQIAFQEEINKNFKEIDNDLLNYLVKLNKEKNYCFWAEKKKSLQKCVDDLEKQTDISWDYSIRYSKACNKSLEDFIKKQKTKSISFNKSQEILDKYNGICNNLIKQKLFITKLVWYDILKVNKKDVLKDEQKKYQQKERTKYDKVLDLYRQYYWNLDEFGDKWPSKTKKHIWW